jgi:hypothetical protein
MSKDWKGNSKSTFAQLGASSHSETERETHDFYATDPKAIELLLKLESFENVWEPACGQGHLSEVLKKNNIHGRSSDLIDRKYSDEILDFLAIDNLEQWNGDIITNPPFKYAMQFVEKSLSLIPEGRKVAMFLRVQFLESKERKQFFKNYPVKTVYIASGRIQCAMNGDFEKLGKTSSAACYCWFIWEKGFSGDTTLKFFN